MNIKKISLLAVAVIVLIAAIFYFVRSRGNDNPLVDGSQSASPSASELSGFTPTPTPSIKPGQKPSPTPTPLSYTIPKCWLGGEIVSENGVFKTNNAYFNYDQVFDRHDFIRWTITPSGENISIGPNMFAGLKLPSGQDTITVGFNSGRPKYSEYVLKASIDYPVELPEGGKVLNTVCSSETKLIVK